MGVESYKVIKLKGRKNAVGSVIKKRCQVLCTLTGFFGNGLFKIPNSTNIFVVVLIVVVLIAITEILFPCVVCLVAHVLTGTPIVVTGKTSYNIK